MDKKKKLTINFPFPFHQIFDQKLRNKKLPSLSIDKTNYFPLEFCFLFVAIERMADREGKIWIFFSIFFSFLAANNTISFDVLRRNL
jgi:hypothetical protein